MNRFYSLIFLFCSYLCIAPASAHAQDNLLSTGVLQGLVTDQQGEFLPGAMLQIIETKTSIPVNKNGLFSIELQPGKYTVIFRHIGFTAQSHKVEIKAGKTTKTKITLASSNEGLQQVEITGRKEKTYKTTASFIGSKSETNLKDLPQSVSYASKELIADQGAMRVGEVVKNFSGVNQFTNYDDLTIRGFRVQGDANTQLLNGLRTSSGFWKQSLANYLERVEVLKGPSSALYGNARPGGVINRVTKKPLDETRKNISVNLGSFNNLRILTDFTGPATKDSTLLYRLNLGYEDADSFRDLQYDKNLVIAPSLSFLPSKKTRINFDMVYTDSKGRLDRGQSFLGSATTPINYGTTPNSLALNTADDHLFEKTYNVSFSLSHRFSDDLTFNAAYLKTGYREDLYEHRSANTNMVDATGKAIANLVAMQMYIRKRERFIDNASGYFTYTPKTGIIAQTIVAGTDYGSEKVPVGGSQLTANGYRNATNTGTIATYIPANKANYLLDKNGNPVPNVPGFNLNDVLNSQRIQDDSKNFYTSSLVVPTYYYLNAGYVQDQIKLGKFQALLGIRYEYYTDFSNYKLATQATTHSSAWLPRFGLVYTINSNINVYGTYVTGYNPQTASNLSNPNAGGPFDPMTSNMIEFGAKSSWFEDMLTVSTAIYKIEQNNVLNSAGDTSNPDLLRQVGKEVSKGIEFDITGRIQPNWSILASYAYNDAQITESVDLRDLDRQKPNAPKNMANIWTRYNLISGQLKGLGIGVGSNYVDKRNVSLNYLQTIPSYLLFNAALYYKIGKAGLQFNMNNITGKKYWVGGYDYLRMFPGVPANYNFGLTYSFN